MTANLCTTEIASAAPMSAAPPRSAPSAGPRYETMPTWGARRFESADTTRLNQAHWQQATDGNVNTWLLEQLSTLRARTTYEARNNGMLLGAINTLADHVVGQDGPTLQVISEDPAYNKALEQVWNDWFAAPTPKPTVSGTAMLRLWVRSLAKKGEYTARIVTDPAAEGPIQMRIQPFQPARLSTPIDMTGDPNVFMGIRFHPTLGRPTQYYVQKSTPTGTGYIPITSFDPVPPDLIIHEFIVEDEDQARGIPWFSSTLQTSADLRDYDDQVQDAARQIADQSALLYTEHPDASYWATPEDPVEVQRRVMRQLPPGWKPFIYTAAQPPVQYPDYRRERQGETARPVGMPLLLYRMDSSRHNYSSARLDIQGFGKSRAGIQSWMSGTPSSYGTLNRLVDLVAGEARFSVPALRRRPARVRYQWTWEGAPHVDPKKEREAETEGLASNAISLIDVLSTNGKTLEQHIAELSRVRQAYEEAGLPLPEWATMSAAHATSEPVEPEAVPNG